MAFWDKLVTITPATDSATSEAPEAPEAPTGDAPAPAATAVKRTPLDWTLEEILAAGGAEAGRNSAETVITLRASLAPFSPEQQLAMVRAMDAVDNTWDEEHVMADANRRVAILDKYTGLVASDEADRVKALNVAFDSRKAELDALIVDLDAQIASLKARREGAVQDTAAAKQAAEEQAKAVNLRADGVRQTISTAVERYKALIKFFGH